MNSATKSEHESLPAVDHTKTKARLGAITRELHDALRALGAAPELQRVIREIPDTRSRLSYVGEMTEKAAHRVLNLVDQAMPALTEHGQQASLLADMVEREASAPKMDEDAVQRMMTQFGNFARESVGFAIDQKQILTDIMMAQDFQDLSGQVIKKVIDMITRTESQLVQLLIDDGDVEIIDQRVEAAVLQGPQTPDNALAQDDVDDLLASMGF